VDIDRIYHPKHDFDPAPAFAIDRKTDEFVGWHVTDQPLKLAEFLCAKKDLRYLGSSSDDLGPGLYVSGQPEVWLSRSRSKWNFLSKLDDGERMRLCDQIRQDPILEAGHGLTVEERKQAEKTLSAVANGQYSTSALVSLLANQPYNIEFGSPEWLEKRGFSQGPQPKLMEIRWRGTMPMLDNTPTGEDLRHLERNHVGAAIKNGFGSVAQAVIWKRESLTRWEVARGLMRDLGLLPVIARTPNRQPDYQTSEIAQAIR
jgi:hypothetical protein